MNVDRSEDADVREAPRAAHPPRWRGGAALRPAEPDSLLELPRERLIRRGPSRRVERPRRPTAFALVSTGLGLLFVALALAVIGAAQIERADRAERLAADALYRQLATDAVLAERPFVTGREEEAAALFARVRDGADPDRRRADARALVTLIASEAQALQIRPLDSEEARRRRLEESLRVLRRLEADLEAQVHRADDARRTVIGRFATLLGA